MKKEYRLIFLISLLVFSYSLKAQETLEEIVTWQLDNGEEFRTSNLNNSGSDINNDGYDDFIHWHPGYQYSFQFFMGDETPNTTYDFEIEVPFGSGGISWGGDLNGDGYKDLVFSNQTDWNDPGNIYVCLGSEEIDLEPELILHGAVTSYQGFQGINGGYDFNGDSYNDILAGCPGPEMSYNGQVDIFLGGEELDDSVDFHIQGYISESFGEKKTVGDINGDGYDDLIASRKANPSINDALQLEIYLGSEEIDTTIDLLIDEIWYDIFEILACGDLNNDNFDDLLITGSIDGVSGIVGIYFGNSDLDLTLTSYDASPNKGFSYINFNNDEYIDLVSTYTYEWIGNINVFLGSEDLDFDPDYSVQFGEFNAYNGVIGCNIGDFNNDGEDEILVNDGIPYNSATLYGLSNNNESNNKISSLRCNLNNYPNPFNPVTIITFDLPENIENLVIEIFDIKGRNIKNYSIKNYQTSIVWDGTDNYNKAVSSGIYLCRLRTDLEILSLKKMLLMK
ncbi:MAG: T9SS type A sorting domain-containing protein [Candidatus Cloacimonetes bacterium]|nr:T9SS type A sorting domain-containing protein [Candidatus Cloacimonadota bacterium]